MNSLEWVNARIKIIKKQIKKLKDMINDFNKELSDSNNDEKAVSFLCYNEAKDKLQEAEYLLTIYQQIKSELEAWYVVKKRRSYAYIKHKNLFDLSVMLSIDDPDCERLLKALEVQNE